MATNSVRVKSTSSVPLHLLMEAQESAKKTRPKIRESIKKGNIKVPRFIKDGLKDR